jgi:hypothetical protein
MKRRITVELEFKTPEMTEAEQAELIEECVEDMVGYVNSLWNEDEIRISRVREDLDGPNMLLRVQEELTKKGIIAGAVVRLKVAAERYPSAYVNVNERGIVTRATPTEVHVRLYNTFEGLAEWGNELHFYLTEPNHVYEVSGLEVVA